MYIDSDQFTVSCSIVQGIGYLMHLSCNMRPLDFASIFDGMNK